MNNNGKISNGLLTAMANFIEVDKSSIFEITIPREFGFGKNEIKLNLTSNLVRKGTEVLIDILDAASNPVFYEISPIVNADKSRSIVVKIDDEVVEGTCKFILLSTLFDGTIYKCVLNINAVKTVKNSSEIKFTSEPIVEYKERSIPTQKFSNISRLVNRTFPNGTVSIQSSLSPKQLNSDPLTVEIPELVNRDIANYVTSNVGTSNVQNIPSEFNLSVLTGRNFAFSSSMKGGEIHVYNINLEVPNDATSSTPFLQHDYSASIINVINSSSIQVFPPFVKEIEYVRTDGTVGNRTFNKLISESNFTASFYDILTLEETSFTQSYAVLNMFNLDVVSGELDKINVSYKGLNNIGSDYQPIGTFEIKESNLLTDSASMFFDSKLGIIEKPIGNFRNGISDFQNNWTSSSISLTSSKSDKIADGIKIQQNEDFVAFRPNPYHRIQTVAGGKFTLKADIDSDRDSYLNPQLDVFISGSFVNSDFNKSEIPFSPVYSSSFGQYIGSFTANSFKNKIKFSTEKAGFIQPVFVHRTGIWHIANIEITSENQSRIFVPMNINSGSEIAIKIDYLNPDGKKSRYSTVLDKIFFTGSKSPSVKLPDGIISGSDQLTSSFDDRYEFKGRGGIYSGSGRVPANTIVSASNIKFETDQNSNNWYVNLNFDRVFDPTLNTIQEGSGSFSITTTRGSSLYSNYMNISAEEQFIKLGSNVLSSSNVELILSNGGLTIDFDSGSHAYYMQFGLDGATFSDFRANQKGIEYSQNMTSSLMANIRSLADVGTVRAMFSSGSLFSSSAQVNYSEISNKPSGIVSSSAQVKILLPAGTVSSSQQINQIIPGIVSSSAQINQLIPSIVSSSAQVKVLLPTGTTSGSEQLTSSYDVRYHRLGTGILSSSNQISTAISGAFFAPSSSLAGRIATFENKTLHSSSIQVNYNEIINKPNVSGSFLGGIAISSGSASSSYFDPRIKVGTGPTASITLTGSFNITGEIYYTGSFATKLQLTWGGSITAGTTPSITWTNMPASTTTWLHTTDGVITDEATIFGGCFTGYSQCNLTTIMLSPGAAASSILSVDYSSDNSSWSSLLTCNIGNTTGIKQSNWVRLPADLLSYTSSYLRLTGRNGDGATDPRFTAPTLLFR